MTSTTTHWSFYRIATGEFTGDHLGCSLEVLLASTPDGCVPVLGRYSPQTHRFDAQLQRVVELEPTPVQAPDPWPDAQRAARVALQSSDTTMHRLTEALVMGETTLGAADVQAFVAWRREARLIAGAEGEELQLPPPVLAPRPPHPAGT